MDALLFAGGLSVPTLINGGLAVLHFNETSMTMDDQKTWKNADDADADDVVTKFVWEVIRLYPAVIGFPYWENEGTRRVVLNIATALQDPAVFGDDAGNFKLRD